MLSRRILKIIARTQKSLLPTRRINTNSAFCIEDGHHTRTLIKEKYTTIDEIEQHAIDINKSHGNFMADKKGNILLDLCQQNGTLPLGYNNSCLLEKIQSQDFHKSFLETNGFQSINYFELLEQTLLGISPVGMSNVYQLNGLTDPLLKAIEAAVTSYKENKRSIWDSSYKGFSKDPSIANKCFTVLTPERSMSDLYNCPYEVQDIPFPSLKHPIDEFVSYNRDEEAKCLEMCFEIIKDCSNSMKHPAALAMNPTRHRKDSISCNYYHTLQLFCKEVIDRSEVSEQLVNKVGALPTSIPELALVKAAENIQNTFGIVFIVNEIDSGLGVTGNIWAHDEWKLPEAPDIVVFGKKLMTSGFYSKPNILPKHFSDETLGFTYDTIGLHLLDIVLKYICEENLFGRVHGAAEVLRTGFEQLHKTYPHLINGISCNGTVCEINFVDKFVKQEADIALLNKGLYFGRNDDITLYMRPALIFNEKHAHYVQDGLFTALHDLSMRMDDKKNNYV